MWGSRWKIGNCVWVPVIGEVNTCTTIKLLANDTILKSQLGLPLTKLYVNIWTIVLWLVSVYIYGSVDEKRIYLHPIFSNSLSCWLKSHLNVTRYQRKFFFFRLVTPSKFAPNLHFWFSVYLPSYGPRYCQYSMFWQNNCQK